MEQKMPSDNANFLRKRLKQDLFYIMGAKCAICGYDKCHQACDFHHIDESLKNFTIGDSIAMCLDILLILEEIKKCVLLCSNCHREYHSGLMPNVIFVSSFNDERYKEVYIDRSCQECKSPLYNEKTNFCSKTCKSTYNQKKQKRNRDAKTVWTEIDVVNLLARNNGVFLRAGKEVGLTDNGVKAHFLKVTGYRTWKEHIASLPIRVMLS